MEDACRPLEEKFASRWIGEPNSGCWLWTGAYKSHGYGIFYCPDDPVLGIHSGTKSGMLAAHRASYLMNVGPIPSGIEVCHKCDTPACVRPDHLFLGTHADNMRDRDIKNRCEHGEDRHNSALTETDIVEIRRSRKSIMAIAKEYGVAFQTISSIKRGKTWKHVHGEIFYDPPSNLPRGSNHHLSKLTEDSVIEIRRRHENGETYKQLSHIFGVSDKMIGMVVRRKFWKHV